MRLHLILNVALLILTLLVLSGLKTDVKYLGFFVMIFVICYQALESDRIEAFSDGDDSNAVVTYDSFVELQNLNVLAKDPASSFLLLDWMNYWARGTSGQRQVAMAWNRNYRTLWRIKGELQSGPNLNSGKPIRSGDIIRLESVFEGLNLHSHPARADYDDKLNCFEVTGFGYKEGDDTNSDWRITIDGGGKWLKSSKFTLQHINTGKYLSAPGVQRKVFPDPNNGWTLGMVCASPKTGIDTTWQAYRVEAPGKRSVRFYTDPEMDEGYLDDYRLTDLGTGSDITIETLRDGNKKKYIQGMIVPEGISVDMYRSVGNKDYFATYNPGRYGNLQLGQTGTIVIRKYCAVISYDTCNFTGRKACLGTGTSKLPFDANSWIVSDDANAKFFSENADWQLTSGQKNVTCKKIVNPTFGPAVDVSITKNGADSVLYRSAGDASSLPTYGMESVGDKLPNVGNNSLQCYLNAGISESYTGGRVWRDISGRNRHFVWDSVPRFSEGRLMSTDINGGSARGPSGNDFSLGDGTLGFTVAIAFQSYSVSDNWGYSFAARNGDWHGLSCHLPESNSWGLSFCSDHGWFAPSGRNGRNFMGRPSAIDSYARNVVVCRRSSNATDGKSSIWFNGKNVQETGAFTAELDLGPQNARIFHNYKGSAEAFAVWNEPLSDDDIRKVTNHFDKTRIRFLNSYSQISVTGISQVLPDLKIFKGLTCFLDARDARSANGSTKIWKDLSGRGNHFTWNSTPTLVNGRFVNIDKNGVGLTGPPSDSFGIDPNSGGFTIFFAAKTNALTTNQAFRFRGDTGYQRGIFCHPSWTDSTIYFDQSGCCDQSTQRVQTKVDWNKFNVFALRRTHSFEMRSWLKALGNDNLSSSSLNRLAIFVNGLKAVEGNSSARATRLNGQPAEIGGSTTENYGWAADIGSFVVFSRALTDGEVKIVSDYLQSPYYGSDHDINDELDSSPGIKAGLCVSQTVNDITYGPSDCLSKAKNANGKYNVVRPDGSGWCFTDPSDSSKWGWCRSGRDIQIEPKYERSQSRSYIAAREYCSKKGGRLCNFDEICDVGPGGRPRVGFESLNPEECVSAGGIYNTQGNYCGTAESEGASPFVIPAGNTYIPIEDEGDTSNSWVNVSGDDMNQICKPYSSINAGESPKWGNTTEDVPQKRNIICCGIGKLSECDKLVNDLETIRDQLQSTDPADTTQLGQLNSQKDDLEQQRLQKCVTETYLKAVDDLASAEGLYRKLVDRVKEANVDKDEVIRLLMDLYSVSDKDGKKYLNESDAKSKNALTFDDDTFHPMGKIPDLQAILEDVQKQITAQIARYNACPKPPTCPGLPVGNMLGMSSPVNASDGKCDPRQLRESILANAYLTPTKLNSLKTLLSPENILKGTDIRNHKDFHNLVNQRNLRSCTSLPSGQAKMQDMSQFNIEDHQDFVKDKYIPLTSVDISRVPGNRQSDARRLSGLT